MKLDFYTKNNEDLNYEIFEVKINDKELSEKIWHDKWVIVSNENKNKFKQMTFNKNNLPTVISENIDISGKILNNHLEFTTFELFKKYFLLKIWSKTKEFKIIMNLFGGCNKQYAVIMLDKPMIMRIYPK